MNVVNAERSLHLNVGNLWLWGPTLECISAEMSSHLNYEIEPRIKCYGGWDPYLFVFSAKMSPHLNGGYL